MSRLGTMCLMIFLGSLDSLSRNETPHGNGFIVGIELSADSDVDYVWPPQWLPPSSYNAVWMVVEKMPRIRDEARPVQGSRPMIASRHLLVNGRPGQPRQRDRGSKARDGRQREQFLVRLEGGRIRLRLSPPRGCVVDLKHKTAEVKLYEAGADEIADRPMR